MVTPSFFNGRGSLRARLRAQPKNLKTRSFKSAWNESPPFWILHSAALRSE